MKSRYSSEGGENSSRNQWKATKKKKNEKRLGGKALSLESFANAKSRASGYNPSIIKKQREFYRNAKYVTKFKKSIKREGQPEHPLTIAARPESVIWWPVKSLKVGETSKERDLDFNDDEIKRKPKANKKEKRISLQDIREDVERKRAEAEKAKMERETMIREKKEERARAEARRKAQKKMMFKKTSSGQPNLNYRIELLLKSIAPDSTN